MSDAWCCAGEGLRSLAIASGKGEGLRSLTTGADKGEGLRAVATASGKGEGLRSLMTGAGFGEGGGLFFIGDGDLSLGCGVCKFDGACFAFALSASEFFLTFCSFKNS